MPLPLTVSCFSKIHIGFTFLILAHPGSPGKGPLNGCVYVCVCVYLLHPDVVLLLAHGADVTVLMWLCWSDMRPISTSTGQCLSPTVLCAWTRFSDTTRRQRRRRPNASQNDDAAHTPTGRLTVTQRYRPTQTMSITRLFVACVTRRWESTTRTKSIISSTFLQAMRSMQERACCY